MKKTVYTLDIGKTANDSYAPEITKVTMPLLRRFAKKIGADFHVIKERKFPDMPPVYEKFQIKELSEQNGDDWSIFFDADTLLHPNMWDVTLLLNKDTTASVGSDFTPIRFKDNKYFRRDGRYIGKGNWCMIASDWCRDVWDRPEGTDKKEFLKELDEIVTPVALEDACGIEGRHLIDDYITSLNIAKYGLKHVVLDDLIAEFKEKHKHGNCMNGFWWHVYNVNIEKKAFYMRRQLMVWASSEMANESNPEAAMAVELIKNYQYSRDKDMDWEQFLAVLPCGKEIAALIHSWGVDVKPKKIKDLAIDMKKQLMLNSLNQFPDDRNRQEAVQAIHGWQGQPELSTFLSVVNYGEQIAKYMNSFGADIKLKDKKILLGGK